MTPERSGHVTEIVRAARERDPAQRDGFVAEACGDDAALRLCVLSVIISIAALLTSEALVRRASRRVLGYDAVGRD